jgi:hypothetical protein
MCHFLLPHSLHSRSITLRAFQFHFQDSCTNFGDFAFTYTMRAQRCGPRGYAQQPPPKLISKSRCLQPTTKHCARLSRLIAIPDLPNTGKCNPVNKSSYGADTHGKRPITRHHVCKFDIQLCCRNRQAFPQGQHESHIFRAAPRDRCRDSATPGYIARPPSGAPRQHLRTRVRGARFAR